MNYHNIFLDSTNQTDQSKIYHLGFVVDLKWIQNNQYHFNQAFQIVKIFQAKIFYILGNKLSLLIFKYILNNIINKLIDQFDYIIFYNSFMSQSTKTISIFKQMLSKQHYSTAFIKVLIQVIDQSTQKTFQQLNQFIKNQIESIIYSCKKDLTILENKNAMCLQSVASYFKLIVKKALKKYGSNIQSFKVGLIQVVKQFLQIIENSSNKIVQNSQQFYRPNIKILVHAYSRSVVNSIQEAHKKYKDIKVYITQTNPYKQGIKTYQQLKKSGVNCFLIHDNQIGIYLQRIDIVIVGAQIVLQNGAILNRIGTYTLALCSLAMKKPFYVFAESFKFYRKFILSSSDIPQNKITIKKSQQKSIQIQCNTIDFTDSNYINLVCTDLGVFTTAAISDGLIKIFK